MDRNYKEIITEIKNFISSLDQDSILIGVDGKQGSGKSYFLDILKNKLHNYHDYNMIVVEADDFLIERGKREKLSGSSLTNIDTVNYIFEYDSMSKTIKQLLDTRDQTIRLSGMYNHETGKKDRDIVYELKNKNLVVVGGPFLLSSQLPRFDLKIFIEADHNCRLKNSLLRAKNRGRSINSQKEVFEKFEEIYQQYFQNKIPQYDMIIDNNDFDDVKIFWRRDDISKNC